MVERRGPLPTHPPLLRSIRGPRPSAIAIRRWRRSAPTHTQHRPRPTQIRYFRRGRYRAAILGVVAGFSFALRWPVAFLGYAERGAYGSCPSSPAACAPDALRRKLALSAPNRPPRRLPGRKYIYCTRNRPPSLMGGSRGVRRRSEFFAPDKLAARAPLSPKLLGDWA